MDQVDQVHQGLLIGIGHHFPHMCIHQMEQLDVQELQEPQAAEVQLVLQVMSGSGDPWVLKVPAVPRVGPALQDHGGQEGLPV